mmetsp:Transcript_20007/g.64986  ORF Transcript_20007/g.64986 Transcript_20007/m.64986 type:complete len:221 (-) Transcript_20007:446-1108(-)
MDGPACSLHPASPPPSAKGGPSNPPLTRDPPPHLAQLHQKLPKLPKLPQPSPLPRPSPARDPSPLAPPPAQRRGRAWHAPQSGREAPRSQSRRRAPPPTAARSCYGQSRGSARRTAAPGGGRQSQTARTLPREQPHTPRRSAAIVRCRWRGGPAESRSRTGRRLQRPAPRPTPPPPPAHACPQQPAPLRRTRRRNSQRREAPAAGAPRGRAGGAPRGHRQ